MDKEFPVPFVARFPVRFQDVDHAGIIFFARILAYCHVALEELLLALEFPPERFTRDDGFAAPFVNVNSDFYAPLRHGDVMVIRLCISYLGRSSMKLHYKLENQRGLLCAKVRTTQVFVDLETMTSLPIPGHVRPLLEKVFCGDCDHS